jgi:hypothetical protein
MSRIRAKKPPTEVGGAVPKSKLTAGLACRLATALLATFSGLLLLLTWLPLATLMLLGSPFRRAACSPTRNLISCGDVCVQSR